MHLKKRAGESVTCRSKQWARRFVLAAVIPFNPANFFPPPPPEEPPLEYKGMLVGNFILPSLWGLQMVGGDLAKQDLDGVKATPVNVLVSDNGVKVGAQKSVQVPGEGLKPSTIKLRITRNTGIGKILLSFNNSEIQKAIEAWNRSVPAELPNPFSAVYYDTNPHANHVAGVIGAENPSFGISPFAAITDFNIFKGVNLFNPQNLNDGLAALEKTNQKIDLINMSHYLPNDPETRNHLRRLAKDHGTIAVVAAGNEGELIGSRHYLANSKEVVVVGSMGFSGALSAFSNFGEALDIVAPGEFILSRGNEFQWRNESLQYMNGTSMATPFVTGSLATLRALLPNARSEDLKTIIYKTAIDLGRKGKDIWYGHGLLNHLKAVNVATRLIRAGLTSQDAITQAMTVEENFQFNELARQAVFEMHKKGFGTFEAEQWARRGVLLTGTPDACLQMGIYYDRVGNDTQAATWKYMAANSEGMKIHWRLQKKISAEFWKTQANRAEFLDDRYSLLNNLSNAHFLLKVYAEASAEQAKELTPFFLKKVASLDERRLKDLTSLVAQKKIGISVNDLVASLSMGR